MPVPSGAGTCGSGVAAPRPADLGTTLDFADESGVAAPLLGANVDLHRVLVDRGLGPLDTAAMMRLHDEPTAADPPSGENP